LSAAVHKTISTAITAIDGNSRHVTSRAVDAGYA
jgi:hypothetical protein